MTQYVIVTNIETLNSLDMSMLEFDNSFIGTIVNLKIKMDDTQDYMTEDEQIDELFL